MIRTFPGNDSVPLELKVFVPPVSVIKPVAVRLPVPVTLNPPEIEEVVFMVNVPLLTENAPVLAAILPVLKTQLPVMFNEPPVTVVALVTFIVVPVVILVVTPESVKPFGLMVPLLVKVGLTALKVVTPPEV